MTESEHVVPDDPVWDDEYLDRVGDRLAFNYDLRKDQTVHGQRFDLYGQLHIDRQKQFFHPAINWANHYTEEYLFARRVKTVTVADLERVVDLGHTLADEIDPDEEHYETEFTFTLIGPSISEAIREFVAGFRDRTLLKHGYYGRYEINLIVSAPATEAIIASERADVADAFALWRDIAATNERHSVLQRLIQRFRR
jgi:hypothetical protein